MKHKLIYFFVLLLVSFFKNGFTQSTTKVGFTLFNLSDTDRLAWKGTGPRPLRGVIWYPATESGVKTVLEYPDQFQGPVTVFKDADIGNDKITYPLIMLSHGSQGNAHQMAWLGHYLATQGFIAAAVSHNGTDAEELKEGGLTLSDFCMWERPKDISVTISALTSSGRFVAHIDTSRIAAAGFSLGGTTAIWLTGATFDRARLAEKEKSASTRYQHDIQRFTNYIQSHPVGISSAKHQQDSFRDKRIKAVFALAPAIGQGFDPKELALINVPVQIVTGEADPVNHLASNAAHFTKYIPSAKSLIILSGERGHYSQPPKTGERPREWEEIAAIATRFFKSELKNPWK